MTVLKFYKCRWCGEVFTIEEQAQMMLCDFAALHLKSSKSLVCFHICRDRHAERIGYGDLVGIRVKDELDT